MPSLFRRTVLRGLGVLVLAAHVAASPALAAEAPLAIKGYDPVAYFTDGKPTRGLPEIEYAWDEHRWRFAVASLGFLVLGGWVMKHLKTQFFPKDLQYLSYVEVWLPEDAPLIATREITDQVEAIVRRESHAYFAHHKSHGEPGGMVSLTTYLGGGGPRFWSSFGPEARQTNYAVIVMQTSNKHDTPGLIPVLQQAMSREVTGTLPSCRRPL